ncbi:MAG: class I SAM-dependent methyltransferase [Epulopiscium sp.]|mgnify:FL=1|nr:class I SAM-dependent methyltransferase [Candidatus Epulonipiscium sp.]
MGFSVTLCKGINRLFPLPVHPFNLQNTGEKTYAQWQFEKGEDTIKFYLAYTNPKDMFQDKKVLDIGCGAAGKTLYYASLGAKEVVGLDVVPYYKEKAEQLAKEKNLQDHFRFVLGDGAALPMEENTFHTVIMNDAMEHVDDPLAVLHECYRVLQPGGKLYVNFPPYYHPYGAHLSDAMGFPWIHLFFGEDTLIQTYKQLVKDLPDGQERIAFRISQDSEGKEYFSYINKMTLKRFNQLIKKTSFHLAYYKEVPLRSFLTPFARIPGLKEGFVKMAVCILEKPKRRD